MDRIRVVTYPGHVDPAPVMACHSLQRRLQVAAPLALVGVEEHQPVPGGGPRRGLNTN